MRLFEFSWPVHELGYTWNPQEPGSYDPADAGQYRRLAPVDPGGAVRRYRPLSDNSALFREFAQIQLGQEGEGIVGFANQYGMLGRPPMSYRLELPLANLPDGIDSWDIYFWWRQMIGAMRDMVLLWEAVQDGETRSLQEHIAWQGQEKVVFDNRADLREHSILGQYSERNIEVIASREVRADWIGYFTPGDLVTPAWFHLIGTVNMWLRGLASPRLQWDEDQGRPVTRIVPGSLLGALWLQFHLAISGQKTYRQCEVCQGWFEISPKVNRVTKQYCGDACRSQAYRDRQIRAQQLYDKGKSFKQIAEVLDSDVPTIKKWIRRRKG